MARRKSFSSIITASIRQAEAERRRLERERVRVTKLAARQATLKAKEDKAKYLQLREYEVQESNADLEKLVFELRNILETGIPASGPILFDSLKSKAQGHKLTIPEELDIKTSLPNKDEYIQKVKTPNWVMSLFPGVKERYQRELDQANKDYQIAYREYETAEEIRREKIKALRVEFDRKCQEHDQGVDELRNTYLDCNPEAVKSYNAIVLEKSEYPEEFPQEFKSAYAPDSKELVIEYKLPGVDVIPTVSEFKYIKTKDTIQEKPRRPVEIKEIYQDLVSSICLRTIQEVFAADQNETLDVVTFNGYVDTIDPATGKDIRPHLISVRVTKERFQELDLTRVDKRACLRNLGAKVSSRPEEMQAVRPVVEFDMFDKRYVDQGDILEGLESRPNLMDLNPWEFENLVSNLFTRMGLETKQTRSVKDGGVDAVAYDLRPVLGGKVIIQAKRYKNVVGVSAVRDLYGTMMNEGANKGILVTTSNYGPDAYDFAKDKPIELIDGGGLLYLLEQNGVSARIVFPVE